MRAYIDSFRGEAPLVTPRALPDNAASSAVNARLLTGDLTAWRQFATTEVLQNTGPVQSIFLLDTGVWLSWDDQVDVARGVIPGDTTRRTYITGLDVPRFTNLTMAQAGAKPWPAETRPLGTPAPGSAPTLTVGVDPTPTGFSVDVVDRGDALASSWTTSSSQTQGLLSVVEQDATTGDPAPSYKLSFENNGGSPAYAYRNFGIGGSSAANMAVDIDIGPADGTDTGIDVEIAMGVTVSGSGLRVGLFGDISNPKLTILTGADWSTQSELSSENIGQSLSRGTWYNLSVTRVNNTDGSMTATAQLWSGSMLIKEHQATAVWDNSDYCAIIGITQQHVKQVYYDNIHVTASGSLNNVITDIATSYVYTFVNDLGEESAPSPASVTISRPDGVMVTVTTATALPTGYNNADYVVQTKRIYRAATGTTGTSFLFVAEIPLSQADYQDTLPDSQLGDVLPSDNWALPPDDLRGILALPNGIMVGFSKNQLCFSAQNQPHAWPVEYRLNTDTNIVGIGNIDNTVVIGTESFLYVATGNDPAAYSMSKFEVPYACSSGRSFAYLTGIGVVFAGPDGLMACAGPGQVRNLTDQTLFTRDQWQALTPSSILGVAHNDIYFMFWENSVALTKGCYAIDTRPNGFGVVEFSFHAVGAYNDPIADVLYLVLDSDDEPTDPLLPVPSNPPSPDGVTIYAFEGDDKANPITFSWKSKLWFLPRPAVMQIAQLRSVTGDYSNIVAKFYGDGALVDELVVDGEVVFTLAESEKYSTFQMELIGTSTVSVLQAAEQVQELG